MIKEDLNDVIRKTFSFGSDASKENEQYIIHKLSSESSQCVSVLTPFIVVDNQSNQRFGAFQKTELDGYLPAKYNDLEHIEVILKTLVQYQARATTEKTVGVHDVTSIAKKVVSHKYFQNQDIIDNTLEDLQKSFDKALQTSSVVRSIWSLLGKNVYVSTDSKNCKFLQIFSSEFVPPAYDALLYIFSLTDERFRQKYFVKLLSIYFSSLHDELSKMNVQTADQINQSYSEFQVRTLLPIIKLTLAHEFIIAHQSVPEKLLENISNYFQNPLIMQEDIYEILENKFSSFSYELKSYKMISTCEKTGHLGEYFFLTIQAEFQKQQHNLELFAKVPAVHSEFFQEIIELGAGLKESFFYSTLYPLFAKYCPSNLLDFAPRCYLNRLNWLLVLDDLYKLGFIGLKPNVTLEYDRLSVIIPILAKFHACTIILEEALSKRTGKKVRMIDDYEKFLEESIMKQTGNLGAWVDSSVDSLYYVAEKKSPFLLQNSKLSKEELRRKLKALMDTPFQRLTKSDKIRNVISHGDTYVPNVMMKFDKNNMLEEVKLIDYQLLRYMPPAYDILFMIYMSSVKKTRQKHMHDILDLYYESFSECLRSADLKSDEIYPRIHFEKDVQYMKPAGMAVAFIYGHLIHLDPKFREEVLHDNVKYKYYMEDHKEELLDIAWKDENYQNMIGGLVEDIVICALEE